jgi:Kef-type K+ transport system membrane component KefB
LLGAAVVDDVLVIGVMTVFLATASEQGGGLAQVGAQFLRIGLVLVLVGLLSWKALPRIAEWAHRLRASQGLLALAVASVLALSWLTEYAGGMAAITGAFLAGLGMARSHLKEEIEQGLSRLAYGFFVPIFLVDVGLQANLREMQADEWVFAGLIVLVAVLTKGVGAGLGARFGGMGWGPASRLGIGMISRGEVGLIVAGVGVAGGWLPPELFRVAVLMVLTTTLITPPLLRWAYSRREVRNASDGDHRPARSGDDR